MSKRSYFIVFIAFLFLMSLYLYGSIPNLLARKLQIPIKKKIVVQHVMEYPIPQVLACYRKTYQISEEEAQEHERELKRFLILTAANPDEPLDLFSPDVDNLWHTFLLFTKEYQTFCHDMFGVFIHHVPKIEIN